jgi:hypothetical protein
MLYWISVKADTRHFKKVNLAHLALITVIQRYFQEKIHCGSAAHRKYGYCTTGRCADITDKLFHFLVRCTSVNFGSSRTE